MSVVQPVVSSTVADPEVDVLSEVVQALPGAVFLNVGSPEPAPASSKIVDPIFGDPVFYENIAQTYEIAADGQVSITGTAEILRLLHLEAAGTAFVTGNASIGTTMVIAGDGTAAVTGDADIQRTHTVDASGEALVTGDASIIHVHGLAGDATASVTGDASIIQTFAISGAGTAAVTGDASIVQRLIIAAAGNVSVTGNATIRQILVIGASGSVSVTGDATLNFRYYLFASGTVTTTGTAEFYVILHISYVRAFKRDIGYFVAATVKVRLTPLHPWKRAKVWARPAVGAPFVLVWGHPSVYPGATTTPSDTVVPG